MSDTVAALLGSRCCDALIMNASELLKLLQEPQELGCRKLSLRCDSANLETVYVVERVGGLAVTDRGDTFQYLDRSGDQMYGKVDVERARDICSRHGADLDDRDEELYPRVTLVVGDRPLRSAVDAVSAVVDEIFSSAMKPLPPAR